MPLITPKKSEKQGDFISRCAGDTTMNKDFPETKQRVAVCYSQWKDAKASAMASFGEGGNEVLFECPECVKVAQKTKLAASEESLEEYKNDFYEMSVGSINSIRKHADNILQSLNDPMIKENLTESWLQGKIAITEDYMLTIHNYVMFVKDGGESSISNE